MAQSLRARGGDVLVVPTDVVQVSACEALLESAERRFGAVHILVNNAGCNHRGPVERVPLEDPSCELLTSISGRR